MKKKKIIIYKLKIRKIIIKLNTDFNKTLKYMIGIRV